MSTRFKFRRGPSDENEGGAKDGAETGKGIRMSSNVSLTGPALDRARDLERAIEDVRASRPTATRVLMMTDDPNVDGRQLASAIDVDPVLSAQVLKLANSAAFGMRRRVASTEHAVSVIGFDSIRAVSALVASGLRNNRAATPVGFWQHAAATASACSVIASRFGLAKGEAFSLGLLHDLGAAILCSVDPAAYNSLTTDRDDTAARCVDEIAEFGMSHAEAGSRLFDSWNFPELFVSAVASHHDAMLGLSPQERVLLAGDALAHLVVEPSGAVEQDASQLEAYGISAEALPDVTKLTTDYAADVLAALPTR